ncbi:phage terminase Nu1 subunit (DNA packaging protein) [Pantoea eucalypti]
MTYSQLAKIYGYDPVTVSRDWNSRGLDISLSDDEIYQWVADNVLTPLRGQTDLKTETQIEQLRLAKAKADIEEMEADLKRKNLVEVDYVTETLSGYFNQLKSMLRSIPNTTYIELFSSEDANQLREKLKDKIDEVLRDIGSYEYEEETENGFSESEETDQDTEQSSEGNTTARENKTE